MSWYVKQLVREKPNIVSSISQSNITDNWFSEDQMRYSGINTIFFDNECYNDLISVDMAFSSLYKSGAIDNISAYIISEYSEGYSIDDIAYKFNLSRQTIMKRISITCEKIAFYLGDHFTNYGYINYLVTKHNLSDKEAEQIKNIILGETND